MSESKPEVLRSRANPQIRRLIRLRDNRARRRQRRVLVDGWRETWHALRSDMQLCRVYVAETDRPGDSPQQDDRRTVMQWLNQRHPDALVRVAEPLMERIGYGGNHRGVVAEFVEPVRSLSEIKLPANPLVLVLDRIEKPGNLGACFRCADAAGVNAVLMSDCTTDLYNPNAIRGSQGAVFHVASAGGDAAEIEAFLVRHRIRPVASRVEAAKPLWTADLTGPLAIIVGSESRGLEDRWSGPADSPIEPVSIPMLGSIDSLNASVTASILMMEARRQRGADRTE